MQRAAAPAEPVMTSDPQRVRAAASGDVAAFEAIAASTLPGAFRLAAAILGTAAEAAEAIEVAHVAAWRELPHLSEPDRFDDWFHRILLDECRMRVRTRATDDAAPATVARPGDGAGPPLGTYTFDRETALGVVERAFDALDADDRAILVLLTLEERSIDDVAARLRMAAATVRWRLHGAREALRKAVEAT